MRCWTFVLLYCFVMTTASIASTKSERVVEVDAKSTIEVMPDILDLFLTIQSKEKTPTEAIAALRKKQQKLLDELKKAKLPTSDVTVSNLSLSPVYGKSYSKFRPKEKSYVVVGYNASKRIKICIQQLKLVPAFITATATVQIGRFYTSYRSSKVTETKDKLRMMAMKAAFKKASQLAKLGKAKLSKVKKIREVASSSWGGRMLTNSFYRSSRSSKIRPGALTFSLKIRVVFYLTD